MEHSASGQTVNASRDRRRLVRAGVAGTTTAALAVGAWFGFWRYHLKRFDVVQPGVLYRAAQPTEFGLAHIVEQHKVRTVLSVRVEDPPLYRGLIDFGEPDGQRESHYAPGLGPRHLHRPLDDEAYWPWLTPTLFEEFYTLMDDPANWPVLVHCLGGRHRTGTFAALFQLEYNRRPVEVALREMYSYDFGTPVPIQEHNLRTYLPRPLPNATQWEALLEGLASENAGAAPRDYRELVRSVGGFLRNPLPVSERPAYTDERSSRVAQYVAEARPFAVCLCQWLIDRPDHALAPAATQLAARKLQESDDAATLSSAAALVADFGSPEQQELLLSLLEAETKTAAPSPRYEALVAGVTNRYTPNRIAYLAPLLNDQRRRIGAQLGDYRYCDTAAMRLTSIVNEPLHENLADQPCWERAVVNSRQWLQMHPERRQLTTLLPPLSHVRSGVRVAREIDGRTPIR